MPDLGFVEFVVRLLDKRIKAPITDPVKTTLSVFRNQLDALFHVLQSLFGFRIFWADFQSLPEALERGFVLSKSALAIT